MEFLISDFWYLVEGTRCWQNVKLVYLEGGSSCLTDRLSVTFWNEMHLDGAVIAESREISQLARLICMQSESACERELSLLAGHLR